MNATKQECWVLVMERWTSSDDYEMIILSTHFSERNAQAEKSRVEAVWAKYGLNKKLQWKEDNNIYNSAEWQAENLPNTRRCNNLDIKGPFPLTHS